MTQDERIRPLSRDELDQAIEWAAVEGWNPGLHDADAFWAIDSEGFVGLELGGELVGCGSVVSYEGRFGFMGLFIVRPDMRGRGLGRRLWLHRRDLLRERLGPGAAIRMDGVVEMEGFYANGGFRRSHEDLRMRCVGREPGPDRGLEPLAELPFAEVAAFDGAHFGVPREPFLRRWVKPEGGLGLALREDGELCGIGIARPCRDGYKVGPLFAAGADAAERIFRGLNRAAVGAPVFLDVPDCNAAAMELAARHGMEETFRCVRMYHGAPPPIDWDRVFGVTTLELG